MRTSTTGKILEHDQDNLCTESEDTANNSLPDERNDINHSLSET